MTSVVDNEQIGCAAAWMPEDDMPMMVNEAVTFHEVLRAP